MEPKGALRNHVNSFSFIYVGFFQIFCNDGVFLSETEKTINMEECNDEDLSIERQRGQLEHLE